MKAEEYEPTSKYPDQKRCRIFMRKSLSARWSEECKVSCRVVSSRVDVRSRLTGQRVEGKNAGM